MRYFTLKILLILGIVFCSTYNFSQNKPDTKKKSVTEKPAEINISGSYTLYPLVSLWAKEYNKTCSKVKINVKSGGTARGLRDLSNQKNDLAMVSRELSVEDTKGDFLQETIVAKDAIVIFMNAKNPYVKSVKAHGLTYREISELFIAQTLDTWYHLNTNAKKINISLFLRPNDSGNAITFATYLKTRPGIMSGRHLEQDIHILDAIKNNEYAISYASSSLVYDTKTGMVKSDFFVFPVDYDNDGYIDETENQYASLNMLVNAIETNTFPTPPARSLYLVKHKKNNKIEIDDFLKWVTTKGQAYVHQLGFARATPYSDENINDEPKF